MIEMFQLFAHVVYPNWPWFVFLHQYIFCRASMNHLYLIFFWLKEFQDKARSLSVHLALTLGNILSSKPLCSKHKVTCFKLSHGVRCSYSQSSNEITMAFQQQLVVLRPTCILSTTVASLSCLCLVLKLHKSYSPHVVNATHSHLNKFDLFSILAQMFETLNTLPFGRV